MRFRKDFLTVDCDPTVGRFTALDPAKDRRGDGDPYGYCVDDPVSRDAR